MQHSSGSKAPRKKAFLTRVEGWQGGHKKSDGQNDGASVEQHVGDGHLGQEAGQRREARRGEQHGAHNSATSAADGGDERTLDVVQ